MKKLNAKGFKISSVDKKAFEHYVLVSMRSWSKDALTGMINKSVKTILRDYYELYKSKQAETVSTDLNVVIPGILAMEEFKPYNYDSLVLEGEVKRKQPRNEEIWSGGFDVEDYEELALKAFYKDPEEALEAFMENKIYQRRKRLVEEEQQKIFSKKEKKSLPKEQDDFIDMVCNEPGYKNRVARDAEEALLGG